MYQYVAELTNGLVNSSVVWKRQVQISLEVVEADDYTTPFIWVNRQTIWPVELSACQADGNVGT